MDVVTLCAAMPGLSQAKATQYLPLMEAAMIKYDITSQARAAMWLAQVGHESESFIYFEELASGAAYEGRKDLGNTQAGDGVKYKGRGPIQITGRANYTAAGIALHLDLVNNPALAAQPQYGFLVSAWWWSEHGVNHYADTRDVIGATRIINGGTQGLSDRQSRYALAVSLGNRVVVTGGGSTVAPGSTGSEDDLPMDQKTFNNLMDAYFRSSPQAVRVALDSYFETRIPDEPTPGSISERLCNRMLAILSNPKVEGSLSSINSKLVRVINKTGA